MKLKLYVGRFLCNDDRHMTVLETLKQVDLLQYQVVRSVCSGTTITFAVKASRTESLLEIQAVFHALLGIGDVEEGTFWYSEVEL